MGEKYTEAQKRAAMKYMREKTDSIQIRSKRGTKERWRNAAIAQGKSLNRFVIETVEREIAAASAQAKPQSKAGAAAGSRTK